MLQVRRAVWLPSVADLNGLAIRNATAIRSSEGLLNGARMRWVERELQMNARAPVWLTLDPNFAVVRIDDIFDNLCSQSRTAFFRGDGSGGE
jgi:hypothetical protein